MILVLCSGGLDSTYMAMDALLSGNNVQLHHVSIKNSCNRWTQELSSFEAIVEQFQLMGFDPKVTTSAFDGLQLPVTSDTLHYLDAAPTILAADRSITEVQVGFIETEATYIEYYAKLWKLLRRIPRREPSKARLEFPLLETAKGEILRKIHPKLKPLTWSCRTPFDGEPCGKCTTCNILKLL